MVGRPTNPVHSLVNLVIRKIRSNAVEIVVLRNRRPPKDFQRILKLGAWNPFVMHGNNATTRKTFVSPI